MAGAGCGWGPFDVSSEPVYVTVTDYEFQADEDYIHGQVAISIRPFSSSFENASRAPSCWLASSRALQRIDGQPAQASSSAGVKRLFG